MVAHLIFALLLLPSLLMSAEFTAGVNRNTLPVNENFTLTLTLKDAAARSIPSFEPLKNAFVIHSQHQSTNTIMTNGHITKSTAWKVVLTPKQEGEAHIPPILLNSSEGMLYSNALTIKVEKRNPSDASSTKDIAVKTAVSHLKPYKNEPIFYTATLTSTVDLSNVSMQKFNIDGAIVEASGEPKVYKKPIKGVQTIFIEFNYFITPIKAGSLKIPSFIIQGSVPAKRKNQADSFFDNGFDSFFLFSDSGRPEPFVIGTDETNLDVQPPVAGITPWLPAKSLTISEIWDDSQLLQEGEPLTRSFKITGEGLMSHQLPSLADLQVGDKGLTIYADKPETRDETEEGKLYSFRNERYTLIPQHSGTIVLPEISLSWWNVAKNEKMDARIPARTLQILPVLKNKEITSDEEEVVEGNSMIPAQAIHSSSSFIYFVAIGLAILCFGGLLWVIALQRKIRRMNEPKEKVIKTDVPSSVPLRSEKKVIPPKKDKQEKLPDLNPT